MSRALKPLPRRVRAGAAVAVVTAIGAGVFGPAAAATTTEAQLRWGVVNAVNDIRAQQGCQPIKVAKKLNKAAQGHADDMAVTGVFSHVSADGRSWITRIRATGWKKPGGENIASGYDTADDVMTGWMNSPAHRANILNCSFRYIGVGHSANGQYWVQDFGY